MSFIRFCLKINIELELTRQADGKFNDVPAKKIKMDKIYKLLGICLVI